MVVSNFDADRSLSFDLKIPHHIISNWDMANGDYEIRDALYGGTALLQVIDGQGVVKISLEPLESFIYQL